MCGISGIFSLKDKPVSKEQLYNMTNAIKHRGPDGHGYWFSESNSLGLGHRRLSIIDLSEAGHQPMIFEELVITFNGEIYNYLEIRKDLISKGYSFKTQTDTEVLIKLYHLKGKDCLKDLDGMFAFAIWDNRKQELFCARDRFGEKPFYYYNDNDTFIFGSEIKQILAAGIDKEINYNKLYYYSCSQQLTDQKDLNSTFYENISQLPHSNYLIINKTGNIQISKYWDIEIKLDNKIKFNEAAEKFNDLLKLSIERRLRSDVKIGTSLSGGLDSTTIAAIITGELMPNARLNTFTATFKNFEKDESSYIDIFKERYSNLNTYYVEPTLNGFYDELSNLYYYHDEPIASTSIYAQYKVMELAKNNNVTVLLDGQGADEYLGGYNKYWVVLLNQLFATRSSKYIDERRNVNELIGYDHNPNLNLSLMLKHPELHKFLSNCKKLIIPSRKKALPVVLNKDIQAKVSSQVLNDSNLFQDLNEVLKQSVMHSGLQELLRFADRNSMAHSREVRLPFLNHDLVQFVFTLPSEYKMSEGWSKYLLRESQSKRLPSKICWRREKIGYVAPQNAWLSSEKGVSLLKEMRMQMESMNIFDKEFLLSVDDWMLINFYFLFVKK